MAASRRSCTNWSPAAARLGDCLHVDVEGRGEFDAEQAFEVVRIEGSMMLPVPAVRRQAAELAQSRDVSSVVFGAAVPLGLLAPALRGLAPIAFARDHPWP